MTFAYVDHLKSLVIPAHSYRLCMVVGIQPGRAGALLDATDAGVPQRFLWLPVLDPDMPDVKPAEPAPLDLMDIAKYWPEIGKPPRILELPTSAAALLDRNRVLRNRRAKGADAALDGHLALCRTKVAIGLMLLHGETKDPTELHWDLAGVVMDVSQETRDSVEADRRRGSRGRTASAGSAKVSAPSRPRASRPTRRSSGSPRHRPLSPHARRPPAAPSARARHPPHPRLLR